MCRHPLRLVAVLAIVAAACGGATSDTSPAGNEPADSTSADASSVTIAPPTSADLQSGASALDGLGGQLEDGFPAPLIDVDQIVAVLPPDGIPAIDDPFFVEIEAADEYLEDSEPVVYVEIDGDARAYPVQILIWHEIVNDVVGGEPLAITYCPLCNSAVSYKRVIGGEPVTFGTSGALYNSALVMYDRATESLWTHYDGRAVVGSLTGTELEAVSSPLLAWSDFKTQFPEGIVLDRDRTGANRAYGSNPYGGYDDVASAPFLFRGDADDRAELLRRVVGVSVDGDAKAWTLDGLVDGEISVTAGVVGTTDVVIFWKAGQASALDRSAISAGRDVGSVAVFAPTIDGRALSFAAVDGGFVDEETATEWSITGRALSGELAGTQLEQVPHLDTFWFAWSSYRNDTELVEG